MVRRPAARSQAGECGSECVTTASHSAFMIALPISAGQVAPVIPYVAGARVCFRSRSSGAAPRGSVEAQHA